MEHNITPPRSEQALLDKTQKISGMTLAQIANVIDAKVPENLLRNKGWVGELMEHILGATARSLPEPDFQYIGVELKTLPLNKRGTPKESTFICTSPVVNLPEHTWNNSVVKKKLQRVLWLPVEADPSIALGNRRIGNGFLWSPDDIESEQLQTDWEEINELISLGEMDTISSHMGEVLQLRPKAANSMAETKAYSEAGEPMMTLPRGYYLRAGFTGQLLHQYGSVMRDVL